MQLCSSPFAHSRFEHLDAAGFPAVTICVSGEGPLASWQAYRATRRHSISTQRSCSRAVGLFIDFIAALGRQYLDPAERPKLFGAFADALVMGTVGDGGDPSGLYWLPHTHDDAKRIVRAVTDFSDWLAAETGTTPLNPERNALISEQVAFWRAWRQASSRSLLAHLGRPRGLLEGQAGRMAREVRIRGYRATTAGNPVKAFPEASFPELLRAGFRRSPGLSWTMMRDQLVALLLHEGGLRISEALHLWTGDVFAAPDDPEAATVRVYHPSDGAAAYKNPRTGKTVQVTRAEYLRVVHGRVPLTQLPGRKGVGWKDPMLNDTNRKFLTVFWRSESASRQFLRLYHAYVQARPRIVGHPYLFVTPQLQPLSVRAYEKVHASAVRRIGLVADRNSGTTPHGHRHAFGLWLARAGMSRKLIKVAMHHKSAFSQDVYTEEEAGEVVRVLRSLQAVPGHLLSSPVSTHPPFHQEFRQTGP